MKKTTELYKYLNITNRKETGPLGRSKKVEESSTNRLKRTRAPATTPEGRENQLISLAYDLIEQRLVDGTATSAETTAILRLGTAKARLEKEKLEQEVKLAAAKTEAIESSKRSEELMDKVIQAMKRYQGVEHEEEIQ
nr:MAG TPA: hypothetical protein [Caudoviricetes sp.]